MNQPFPLVLVIPSKFLSDGVPTLLPPPKFQDFLGPREYFSGPLRNPQQRINIKTVTLHIECDSGIHTAMFIAVTHCKEKCLITERTNHKNLLHLFTHNVPYIAVGEETVQKVFSSSS